MIKKIFFRIVIILTLLSFFLSAFLITQKPRQDREWELGQEKIPQIILEGDTITVENLRDFHWTGPFEAEPRYITTRYSFAQMQTVDVVISHFSDFEGMAHIFLSFGFTDGRHLSVSIETRREQGEEFSPWLGLLRQFELIYVVGSDNDLIGVRTGPRKERVYIYPTVASPEKTRELFQKVASDVNALHQSPEFYNTLLDNCTNRLTRRVEDISDIDFPFTYKSLLPGYFDEVLYKMRLIDTTETFENTKSKALVANESVDIRDQEYPTKIRSLIQKKDSL